MRAVAKNSKPVGREAELTRIVERILNRTRPVEKKVADWYPGFSTEFGGNSPTFLTKTKVISPAAGALQISQGVGQGARVGNKLHIVKGRLRGQLTANPYNATSNLTPQPAIVRMVLFHNKDEPTSVVPPGNTFFQAGGTNVAPSGNVGDAYAKINTDNWVVHYDHLFKIGYSNSSGTGVNVASQSFTNNDFNFHAGFDIDITPMLEKNVTYNDTLDDPSSRNLLLAFFVCPAGGNALATTQTLVSSYVAVEIEYTDE
jgi:hypothetical protein